MPTTLMSNALCKNRAVLKSLNTKRIRINVISCSSGSRFSSSIRTPDPKRENTNNLRALRKGRNTKISQRRAVDYRYRNDTAPTSSSSSLTSKESLSKLWGSEIEVEEERQKIIQQQQQNSGTVASRRRNPPPVHHLDDLGGKKKFVSFFDEVDEKMERNKRGSLLGLKKKDKNVTSERKSGIDELLDALHSKDTKNTQNFDVGKTHEQDELPTTIFEAFKQKSVNPNAYEKNDFEEYRKMMEDVVRGEKFGKKHTRKSIDDEIMSPVIDYLLRNDQVLQYNYPSLKDAAANGNSMSMKGIMLDGSKKAKKRRKLFRPEVSEPGSPSYIFHEELERQKNTFMELMGFDEVKYDLTKKAFLVLAARCAQQSTSTPLVIAWEKIKEAGVVPANEMLNVFLYAMNTANTQGFLPSSLNRSLQSRPVGRNNMSAVMSILGSSGASSNTKNEEDNDSVDFPTEVALFHDLLYIPTEKSVSLRVKKLISIGDASNAQSLLDSFTSNNDARLRTYLPIMKLYCEQCNVSSALQLFKRMREAPNVILEPENYVLLISTLAENGIFRLDSDPVDGAIDIGYENDSGPKLFDELLSQMSEDVLEISSASARRLYNALAIGFEKEKQLRTPKPIHSLGSVPLINELAGSNDLIASRVNVGRTTGLCPRSDVRLRLINLDKDHRKQLHNSLLNLSEERYEEFAGKGIDKGHAALELDKFANWLDNREGDPFTAIVDGANVGYYMQNFDKGRFNFFQIKFMVEALESMNENPLVILPYKYFHKSFGVLNGTNFRTQRLTTEEKDIIRSLTKKGQLYRVPQRCLDDFYWMLASVSDQTVSRNGVDIDVRPDNDDGRWPGARPMLISNDQMRDHKLGLLEPRVFRRWTSCYIVNYSFTAFVGSESADKEMSFSTADFFSQEIQSNQTKEGTAWHFPVRDWPLNDRFCVRIPSTT